MALFKDDQMDIDTPEKGTYQLREEQQNSSDGSGDCKDKDKEEKDKQNALYEKCCRDLERAYDTVNRAIGEKVSEFCSLQKYYRQNELMPRELYNFYNAVTTNKHEFLMLEKALDGLKRLEEVLQETMFGTKPAEAGERAYVDWAENMPSDDPEVNRIGRFGERLLRGHQAFIPETSRLDYGATQSTALKKRIGKQVSVTTVKFSQAVRQQQHSVCT